MKKAILYLLLFTYSLSVVKPMLPFVADAVAHAFFYQKHITTVHWKNGESHFHHKFVNQAEKDAKESNTSKKLIEPDEYIVNNYCYSICKPHHPLLKQAVVDLLPHAGYLNCFLPPPDFIVA